MSRIINAVPPYKKRPVPGLYDTAFFNLEFGNIQRGSPSHTGQVILSDIRVNGTLKYYWCDTTNGAITVTLSRPDQVMDLEIVVKKIDASANAVTIVGTVDGVVNPQLTTQYDSMTIVSSGAEWYLISTL